MCGVGHIVRDIIELHGGNYTTVKNAVENGAGQTKTPVQPPFWWGWTGAGDRASAVNAFAPCS